MNDWLEYTVPKKFVRLYMQHIAKNVFLLVFILFGFFGKMPTALSFWVIVLMSDAAFYYAMKGMK
tara:strand:- start:331 stop:525 length:195 start_codon:yes stop_codon:yes gene_type:complete